jgi:hypothetical protein
MGCNVCRFNNENNIEYEFKYPNSLNIYSNENINENKEINKSIHKEKDKEKEKENILSSAPLIKPNKNEVINNLKSQLKNEENIDNMNKERVNQNDNTNNNIIKNEIIKIENKPNIPQIIKENKNNNKSNDKNNLNLLKSTNKQSENEKDNIKEKNKINVSISSVVSSSNKGDYNSRILDLINKLRTDPKSFAEIILSNMQYINKKIKIVSDNTTGHVEEKIQIFFQKKVKVELYRGEEAFIETANFLNNLKPLNQLIYKDDIKINILPENEEEIKNDKFLLKDQIIEIRKKSNISAFFKDNVKNPEIGLMLMIIGDYKTSQNKKRNTILNPDYKYIAVNSKFIGQKFVSYFTFSK